MFPTTPEDMDVVLGVFQHLGLTVSDLDAVAADACLGVFPVGKVPRHAPEVTTDEMQRRH